MDGAQGADQYKIGLWECMVVFERSFTEQQMNLMVGSLYEKLDSENPWLDALEHVRVMLNASNAMLRIGETGAKPREAIFACGPKVDLNKIREFEEDFVPIYFPPGPPPGQTQIFRWEDVAPDNPKMDILRETDASWTIVYCLEKVNDAVYVLIASRGLEQDRFDKNDVELIKRVGIHFQRALNIRRSLTEDHVVGRFQSKGLSSLAIKGFMVGEHGEVSMLTEPFEEGHIDEIRIVNGKIRANNSQENRKLQAIIEAALANRSEKPFIRGFSLSRDGGKRDLSIIVSGRKSTSLVSGEPTNIAIVFVRDSEATSDADNELMRQLFSFTRAEANLAIGMAKGMRMEDLEKQLNICHNTARAHLRSMFMKSDVKRQSDLVQLLTNSVVSLGDNQN